MIRKTLITMVLLALFAAGSIYAGDTGFACLLKGSYTPEDTTYRVTSLSGNSLNRPAHTWMLEAFGDTVDVTIYGPEGSFSWRFSPGVPGDTTAVAGLYRLSSRDVPVQVDSLTINRASTQAEAKFIGVYLK